MPRSVRKGAEGEGGGGEKIGKRVELERFAVDGGDLEVDGDVAQHEKRWSRPVASS